MAGALIEEAILMCVSARLVSLDYTVIRQIRASVTHALSMPLVYRVARLISVSVQIHLLKVAIGSVILTLVRMEGPVMSLASVTAAVVLMVSLVIAVR